MEHRDKSLLTMTTSFSNDKFHSSHYSQDNYKTDSEDDSDSETRREMMMGVEKDDETDGCRTPPPTGPIIELRSREVIFAILIFFLLAVVVGLIVVLGSLKVKEMKADRKLEEALENQNCCKMNKEGKTSRKGNYENEQQSNETIENCASEEIAESILKNMNTSVDPCQDFFTYACGGFLESKDIPLKTKQLGIEYDVRLFVTYLIILLH